MRSHLLGMLEPASILQIGVLPTVVSPGAIWAEVEPGFHIELETAIWADVLPDKRRDGAQVRRRQPPSPVRPSEHQGAKRDKGGEEGQVEKSK
jgi:hypothetical protein